jgi:hypothetical protein
MKNFLCVMFLLAAVNAPAQTIPDSMIVDWTQAGFEGVIPEYSTILDITSFGAIAGDSIDDQPAVVAAISSLNGNAGVIYFPPGNYLLNSSVPVPDSTVIRGAGSDSTFLSFNFGNNSGNSFNITGSITLAQFPILSGLTKGSNELIITDADSIFAPGDEIEIFQDNGSWDTNPAVWAAYAVGHLSRVDSVNGDTLWLQEALRMDLDIALNPVIRKIYPRKFSGLECFTMVRADSNAAGINYAANFSYAKNCWMRGVESRKSICAHVAIEASSHIEISGCYFQESYLYDGASTHGYGIVLYTHACANKIEDNIFRMLRHAMIAKQGANGNVFGYNYSRETNRSEAISDYAADICMHGHYAFSNLFEGNIVQNLQIDQAWGPSGPFNTFFRNKVENYGILMTSGTVESDRQNIVGNDVSNMTIFHGLYSLAGTGHFEFGNNVRGTITPTGTTPLPDVTYYLDSIPPPFWNILAQLPSIGIPNAFGDDINPALGRYNAGGKLTLCGWETDTTIFTEIINPSHELAPTYFFRNNMLHVELNSNTDQNLYVRLISITGQEIISFTNKVKSGMNRFNKSIPETAPGLYFIQMMGSEINFSEMVFIE